LDHLRLASVRFNSGGSGSLFASRLALLPTITSASIAYRSCRRPEHDTVALGFEAAEQKDEKACPDLEINVLLRIEDVTLR